MPLWGLHRYGSALTRLVCSRAETVVHTPLQLRRQSHRSRKNLSSYVCFLPRNPFNAVDLTQVDDMLLADGTKLTVPET